MDIWLKEWEKKDERLKKQIISKDEELRNALIELETLKIDGTSSENLQHEATVWEFKKEIADLWKENTILMNEQMEQLKFKLHEPESDDARAAADEAKILNLEQKIYDLQQKLD